MAEIYTIECHRLIIGFEIRLERKLDDEEDTFQIIVEELEKILYDRKAGITPTQFRTHTALMECKSFEEVASRLSEAENKKINIEALEKRAERTLDRINKLLGGRLKELYGV